MLDEFRCVKCDKLLAKINAVVKLLYQKRNTARQGYKTENGAEGTALLNAKENYHAED